MIELKIHWKIAILLCGLSLGLGAILAYFIPNFTEIAEFFAPKIDCPTVQAEKSKQVVKTR